MSDERTLPGPSRGGRTRKSAPAARTTTRFDASKHGLLVSAMLIDDGAQKENAAQCSYAMWIFFITLNL